jgi:xylem cysteine proteinase
MKLFVACIVLASVVAFAASEFTREEKKVFREWRKKHKKVYKSHEEEIEALEKFVVNMREIEEHNKLYDQGKVTFKRKLWEFSDFSIDEKRKFLHGVNVPQNLRSSRNSGTYPHFPAGPKSIDWRKKGLVGPVENQGACSSCWAFSTAAIVESVMRKKHHNKALVSPQQLVDCSHTGTTGCIGGWPEYALDYVKNNGITDEEEYPYVAYERTCEYRPSEKVGTITGVHNIPTRGNETWLR